MHERREVADRGVEVVVRDAAPGAQVHHLLLTRSRGRVAALDAHAAEVVPADAGLRERLRDLVARLEHRVNRSGERPAQLFFEAGRNRGEIELRSLAVRAIGSRRHGWNVRRMRLWGWRVERLG